MLNASKYLMRFVYFNNVLNFLSFYSNALVLLNKTNRRFDHSAVAIISVMVIFDTKKNDLRM